MNYIFFNIVLIFFIINSCGNNSSKSIGEKITMNNKLDTAIFGGGCFWCVEAVFQRINGVVKVESGYSGGSKENPTYKEVCTGNTGHAEVVRITFNPDIISYLELLEVFFGTHDPTSLNRQGADVGTQYRSVIFYLNENQKNIAVDFKEKLNEKNVFGKPVVTEISPLEKFYIAEDYHQNYYNNNKYQPYCSFIITPKIDKLIKNFRNKIVIE